MTQKKETVHRVRERPLMSQKIKEEGELPVLPCVWASF